MDTRVDKKIWTVAETTIIYIHSLLVPPSKRPSFSRMYPQVLAGWVAIQRAMACIGSSVKYGY